MNIKWGKFFLAGIITAIISYVINSTAGFYMQDLYDPTSGLWRAMFTPTWTYWVVGSTVVLAFVLVFAYAMMHRGLGKMADWPKKGLKFGLLAWLLGSFTGSLITYVYMPVPTLLPVYWALVGLGGNLIMGLVIAWLYR